MAKKGRPGAKKHAITVRFNDVEVGILDDLCEIMGSRRSEVVRAAVMAHLERLAEAHNRDLDESGRLVEGSNIPPEDDECPTVIYIPGDTWV